MQMVHVERNPRLTLRMVVDSMPAFRELVTSEISS